MNCTTLKKVTVRGDLQAGAAVIELNSMESKILELRLYHSCAYSGTHVCVHTSVVQKRLDAVAEWGAEVVSTPPLHSLVYILYVRAQSHLDPR